MIPKRLTSSGQVTPHSCRVTAITLTPGADDATVSLHNSTDDSGTVLWKVQANGGESSHSVTFPSPLQFDTACYAKFTGTSPEACVAIL